MTEFDWNKSRKKMKNLFDEGLVFLKGGAIEAQHLTEATIGRLKTELEIKRLIHHVNNLKILLGNEAINLFDRIPQLKTNKIIVRLVKEIRLGETTLEKKQKQINKMTVVKKSSKKKKAAKKKKKVTKKTAVRRKK